jgi:hypothetical protein
MNQGALNEGRLGAPVGAEEIGVWWRVFFWCAALFNFGVGLVGMLVPPASLDGRLIGVLVFAFGIIYVLVARDPLRYRSALWAGVVSKGGIVALLATNALERGGDTTTIAVAAIDAVFVLGFLGFLLLRDDAG